SERYIRDRFLPDKAIDLIDQASARVRLRTKTKDNDTRSLEEDLRRLARERDQATAAEDYERASEIREQAETRRQELDERRTGRQRAAEITPEDIAEVVSRATGVPVSQLTTEERERLMRLEEELHGRIVGQEEAVSAVAEAVRRSRAGLGDPRRPVGSFLFLGPTGVGKTELARALAEALFGDENLMVRFDMSEFQERHTVSRLVGAPPGYVGYEEAGQLTERVRRRPYSVVLFDEIAQAHADVFNVLRQFRDDGFTDEAIELIAHEGFDPEFGARPLRRTIQRLVENELSRMVLSDAIGPGDRVTVDALEGKLRFDVDTGAAREGAAGGREREV